MPKKGDNVNRNSKKSQKKEQKKYNVYSQKTVRIKEALLDKQKNQKNKNREKQKKKKK